MSKQATGSARRIHEALEIATGYKLDLEKPIPWPKQDDRLWPRADISGQVRTGEVLIVEINDHSDPARSVVKYWPLLHAMDVDKFQHPPIAFVEVSRPDDTFGDGYQLLAQFIGERREENYPNNFRFRYVGLGDGDPQRIVEAILAFLREGGAP